MQNVQQLFCRLDPIEGVEQLGRVGALETRPGQFRRRLGFLLIPSKQTIDDPKQDR